MRLTELKLYLCLEVTEQNINLECATVTEVLTFYCIPHVTLLKGQLCSPKETLMSLEFFCKLLLGKKELRDSCSEQFSRARGADFQVGAGGGGEGVMRAR